MTRRAIFCNVPSFAVDLVEMAKSFLPKEQADETLLFTGVPLDVLQESVGEDVSSKIVEVIKHDQKVWELYNPPEPELDDNWDKVLMATT